MKHGRSAIALALLAAGIVLAPMIYAGDENDVLDEVSRLREELKSQGEQLRSQQDTIDSLGERQTKLLHEEMATYLDATYDFQSAQGSGQTGITISANFTGVLMGTVDNNPADRLVGDGDYDLNFIFKATDNLEAFIYLTGNNFGGGGFESQFGSVSTFKGSFGPIGGTTAGALLDGVGVDGTQAVRGGSIVTYEVGIHHQFNLGSRLLHWEVGQLDPRRRFSQNAFADDENTQFLNNQFDDPVSVPWLSVAPGTPNAGPVGGGTFGLHMWMSVGEGENITLNWGWFSGLAGQIFDNGQFFFQISYSSEAAGKPMNLRLFGFIDASNEAPTDEDVSGGGLSWDWKLNDRVGWFVRVTATGGDSNPADFDAQVGVIITGLAGSRPDDALGIAVGWISLQAVTRGPVAGYTPIEDTEVTVEVFYKWMAEDGKLQITPFMQFINDPGGGVGFTDDTLYIIGIRFHVPF